MNDVDKNTMEISILRLSNEEGDVQDFIVVKEFEAFGLDVIAIYPCDENLAYYENAEYEFLYKDKSGNVIFSDGRLYELLYYAFSKTLQ